ncbi:(2Fe-2S)-binding protein [Fictibacillus sp. WQ 8-8]|uniref:(2Fe-2S)-binding protein n=1 Tax=Fictibacillus marinisediminis TaxID=2878389 RepID=A0A9X2BH81_9BACL|nr:MULTISPECIES: (2Fe-2S)-binding protein [Fictibacillus]SFD94553.1 carbon-monoxide dehydrogenase small subunit/2-furoyl-CoA dehydrogenase 2Fe-2S iron sulfur subunit [Bacillus sp. OV194]MCK6257323.1 (2Fe-2S)-binding protein [Fictibacillus marinisediminis]MCQ6267371.1 (2Fe-2S)-binding protein [Fictibacillus sp. WQ 8-8]MED2974849.1 (2Fe-2S)-binding protein [Fictibacillus sp. B-59209]UZJ76848.1 (2Fe-2S)-binding protein [Fictibacillus sp. KU28468]
MSLTEVNVTINGKSYSEWVEPRMLLSDFIRESCGLTGTHVGCEHGVCGACTVSLDGSAVRSCLIFAVQADNREIKTVEGLASSGEMTTLQKNFVECHGLQCGFCTAGILMSITDFLEKNPQPSVKEIKETLSGHLCRCTGYDGIVKAVEKTVQDNNKEVLQRS